MGRRRLSRAGPIPRREQLVDRSRVALPVPDLHQRARDVADHVLEEGGRLDGESDALGFRPDALHLDVEAAHFANGGFGGAVRGAEGGEVVPAEQRAGGGAHRLGLERPPDLPHPAAQQRRAHGRSEDLIDVSLPARPSPRIESGRRFLGSHASDL